jgi:excinuclease ABC subunit A
MSRTFVEITPQNFSFNSPLGWCPACQGLGTERGTNQGALISNPNLSLLEGAVSVWPNPQLTPAFRRLLEAIAAEFEIPLSTPWYQLEPTHQRVILYGSGDRWIDVPGDGGRITARIQYKGLYPSIDDASRVSYAHRQRFLDMVGEKPCSVCNGDRMRPDAAAVRVENQTLPQLSRLPLIEILEFLKSLTLNKEQKKFAGDLLHEAIHRLSFLVDVGLDYLTLDRSMPTLSGGESQRIRLAGQIGRALTGVLYVLDEPTIGLHPRDNGRLISALHRLRDLGNTVVLVEHDREVLESADRLYDFGPGAGRNGGNVTAQGTPKELEANGSGSLTGAYLSGAKGIPIPTTRRLVRKGESAEAAKPKKKRKTATLFSDDPKTPTDAVEKSPAESAGPPALYETPPGGHWLELRGAKQHNLRGVDLYLPLGTFSAVTGLSGSGKSSLIMETLARAIARHLHRVGEAPGAHDELRGVEHVNKVIIVDQSPLGSTPASNPATYTGVWDPIRELFARMPDAKIRGYKPTRFSFNRPGGRCEECEGMGQKKIEMHFLPDVWVECTTCKGQRFNQETLSVRYRNRSIADVLNMSVGEALETFENIPKIRAPLATLAAIGLDYLTLGQSAATLSGGEAQRVKLASELCRPNNGQTLYLLDEPTTGLHFDDIAKLLKVLNSLVEAKNTCVVIEHNLDVIKTADWIVDMGPEAGVGGGWIVAQGTPEEVVEYADKARPPRKNTDGNGSSAPMRSWTGELLKPVMEAGERADLEVFDASEVARKKAGDIDIAKVGKDAAAPWKADGRKWHVEERLSHNGKPVRWEGTALAKVIDALSQYEDLASPNWNHRSIVEVMASEKSGGWFLHAQTGDEWLLVLKFRVKKNSFNEELLARRLALKSLDDLDELPVYGRGDRVRVKNLKGPWQEVTITVHWLREIETPAFDDFLKKAVEAFLPQARVATVNPTELMPWTVLGRKWHVSRKGFPSNKRVDWDVETLETLLQRIESAAPKAEVDWSGKTTVSYTLPGQDRAWAEVVTKRRSGIDLVLYGTPGRFALGRITELGAEREIGVSRDGRQMISLRLVEAEEVESKALADFLKEHARGEA